MIRASKEAVIAIGLGIAVGVVVAYGVWTANKALKKAELISPTLSTGEQTEAGLIATPTPVTKLEIEEPKPDMLTDTSLVTIAGKAPAGSVVIISGEDSDQVVKATNEGVFSGEVELIKGVNDIMVAAIESNGNKQAQSLTITYSTANID
jgi:hypothetical protein